MIRCSLFHLLGCNPLPSIVLMPKLLQIRSTGSPFLLACASLTCDHHSWGTSVLSGMRIGPDSSGALLTPAPESARSLRKVVFRNQDLGPGCAPCYCGRYFLDILVNRAVKTLAPIEGVKEEGGRKDIYVWKYRKGRSQIQRQT